MPLLVYILLAGILATTGAFSAVHPDCDDAVLNATLPLISQGRVDDDALSARMLAAREGDSDAQAEIYLSLLKVLPRQVRARAPRISEDTLEDVVHRVLFRIIERGYEFDSSKAAYSTWSYWYITDAFRLTNGPARQHNEASLGDGEENLTPLNTAAASDPTALDSLIEQEKQASVKEALHALCERERDLLIARFIDKKTLSDQAEKAGVSMTTISNHQSIAIEHFKRRLEMVEKAQFPLLRRYFSQVSPEAQEAFSLVAWDEYSIENAAKRLQIPAKELNQRFLRALGWMAHLVETQSPDLLEDFWEECFDIPGIHREVAKQLVAFYKRTGQYPTVENVGDLFEHLELKPAVVFGTGPANPHLGPRVVRVFHGDAHVLWAFARQLLELPTPIAFDPFVLPFPRHTGPYRSLAVSVYERYRFYKQRSLLDRVIQFYVDEGRLPDPVRELSLLAEVPNGRKTVLSYGAEFKPGGNRHGFGVFDGKGSYERLLLARSKEISGYSPEQISRIRRMSRENVFSFVDEIDVPITYRRRFPQMARVFEKLPISLRQVWNLRYIEARSIEKTAKTLKIGQSEVLDKETRALLFANNPQNTDADLIELQRELLEWSGITRFVVNLLVDHYLATQEILVGKAQEKLLEKLETVWGINAKEYLGRIFESVNHVYFLFFLRVEALRKADQDPRLDSFNIYEVQLGPPSAFNAALETAFEAHRPAEQKRILDLALADYLQTRAVPNSKRMQDLTGIGEGVLFNPQTRPMRKYFDSTDDFYLRLRKRAAEKTEKKAQFSNLVRALDLKKSTAESETGEQDASIPAYWSALLHELTVDQRFAFVERSFKGNTFRNISQILNCTQEQAMNHYFKALNASLNAQEKTEQAFEKHLNEIWNLEGPQNQILEAMVDEFEQTGLFPQESNIESIRSRLPFRTHMPMEQMLGLKPFASQDNGPSARAVFGPFHLVWAFDKIVQRRLEAGNTHPHLRDFSVFAMDWKVDKAGALGRVVVPLTEKYRPKEQQRVLQRAHDLVQRLERAPTLDELQAAVGNLSGDQIAGRGIFAPSRTQKDRSIFRTQAELQALIKKMLSAGTPQDK